MWDGKCCDLNTPKWRKLIITQKAGLLFYWTRSSWCQFPNAKLYAFWVIVAAWTRKSRGLFDAHASRRSARWMVRKEDPGQLAQAALEKEDWCILAKKNYTTNVAFVVLRNETWANVIRGRFLTGRSSCEKRKHERSQSTIICWTRSNCCRSQNTSGWTVLLNQVSSFNQRFWVEVGRRIDC